MPKSIILQIIADGAPGGGTTVVLGLCEDLHATSDYKVVLITQPDSYALQQAKELGILTLPFDFFSSRFDRSIPRRLLALIESVNPDLIHVHGARAAFPFCSSPLKQLSCPLVYTVHGYHFRLKRGPLKWLGWFAEWQIARHCRFLTWVSQGDRAIAEHWRLIPADRSQATVIFNGIHPDYFEGIEPQDKCYDLVFAGRLDTPKNPLFMVDILICLKDRPISLLLVGGGHLESQLNAYAQSKGVDHLINFTGALSHYETLQALRSARIAVLPSLWEGFPVLPLEAGYLEIPVVAANIPGVDEIIVDGKNGYLIPNHDPALYAAAIGRLLDNPALAGTLGKQAKQWVEEKFLRKLNTEKFIDLYGSISKNA